MNLIFSMEHITRIVISHDWAQDFLDRFDGVIHIESYNLREDKQHKELCVKHRESVKKKLLHIAKIKTDPDAMEQYNKRIEKLKCEGVQRQQIEKGQEIITWPL